MTQRSSEWQEIVITIDSGASESVCPPSAAPNVSIVDSIGSRQGATYEVANGQIIDNLGQKDCLIASESQNGEVQNILSFQVCQVHKPLLSVSAMCKAGHAVVFHPKRSYIQNIRTGETIDMVERDGLYELRCWVKPSPDFVRQGTA